MEQCRRLFFDDGLLYGAAPGSELVRILLELSLDGAGELDVGGMMDEDGGCRDVAAESEGEEGGGLCTGEVGGGCESVAPEGDECAIDLGGEVVDAEEWVDCKMSRDEVLGCSSVSLLSSFVVD